MKKLCWVLATLLLVALLCGCSSPTTSNVQQTKTSAPTSVPKDTPLNDITPDSSYTASGSGDKLIKDISFDGSISVLHLVSKGSRNIVVWYHDSTGGKDLLVNEIGKYDGYTLIDDKGPGTLEIKASGQWTVDVRKLGSTSAASFQGKGDFIVPIFKTSTNAWKITCDGKSNFIVKQYSDSGSDLLVNEIGKYSGEVMSDVDKGVLSFFEIQSDGNWTISPL